MKIKGILVILHFKFQMTTDTSEHADFLCSMFMPPDTDTISIISIINNITTDTPLFLDSNNQTQVYKHAITPRLMGDHVMEDIKFYIKSVISPIVCFLGIIGNLLNILVLTRRKMQTSLEGTMEKAAYLGLIALTFSDLLYCLCAFPDAFIGPLQTVYPVKTFGLYVSIYGPCLQNLCSKISTWLTVIMAGGRYAAICHPLHARRFVHLKGTGKTHLHTNYIS